MRLKRFKINNYRCILDSGETEIGDYIALVGKNESGKTAILKALHKFNPARKESFNGLKEFPRRRFHDFKGNEQVSTLTFELTQEEQQALKEIHPTFGRAEEVQITQDYSSNYTFKFLPDIETSGTSKEELLPLVKNLKEAIKNIKDANELASEFRQNLASEALKVDSIIENDLKKPETKKALETWNTNVRNITTQNANDQRVVSVIDTLQDLYAKANESLPIDKAKQYILQQMPRFVYFENYAIIDSRIHLPSFVSKLESGHLSAVDRTEKTLFEMVNLDPVLLHNLGKTEGKSPEKIRNDIDERAIRVSRASLTLSGDIVDIWKQSKNRVEFDVDGDHLRLWVIDNVDGSKLELEERSKGYQWFFSFYVVFNVESERGHKDTILLLDEPGLHLHAAGQEDLLQVMRELSKDNQIIYTTHSPFMVDMTALDSIRTVTTSQEVGTKISGPMWATDKDALFPLQAALGYSISQSLFIGKYNLVVEGITDFWLISSISQMFKESNLKSLDDKIVISPAGGAQKTTLLAAMLKGQKLNVVVLLDADAEGKKARDDLVKNKMLKESNVIYVSETATQNREMELEDLFPEEFYVNYVNESYKKELGDKKVSVPVPGNHPLIRRKLEDLFQSYGLTFHKTRPARRMLEDFGTLQPSKLPRDLTENMQKLFDLINSRMPK